MQILKGHLKRHPWLFSHVGAAAVLLGLATVSNAGVIFATQENLRPPREQVLFNGVNGDHGAAKGNGLLSSSTLQGRTNQTDSIIDFMGDEPLITRGSGQAGIAAGDGGLTTLTIEPADDLIVFTGMSFNLFAIEDGEVTISAVTTTGTETRTLGLRRNGQNRFTLTTDDDDQLVQSVSFNSTVDLSDVRQVRLQNLAAVPEPATLGLLAMGGLLTLRRRR